MRAVSGASPPRLNGEAVARFRGAPAVPEAVFAPVATFLLSRVILILTGRVAESILGSPHIAGNASSLPPLALPPALSDWVRPWIRFDAGWYVGVAEHGYHWGALGKANTNFLPLYPALVRLLSEATRMSPWLSSLVLANAGALAALLVLWRWATLRWNREVATRCLLLAAFFPFSFFLAIPYAESLFLALAAGAFLCAEQNRWAGAISLAALCTVTRPVGMAVVAGLMVLAYSRGNRRLAALASLGLLPLMLFAAYLGLRFGHPLGFLTYHSAGWVPASSGVLPTIASQFHTSLSPFDRIDFAVAALFLASSVAVWHRVGKGYGAYVLVGLLLPLAHGIVSMERYVVVLFPVFALWATWKSRAGQMILLSASLLGFVLFSMMFAAGYSVF